MNAVDRMLVDALGPGYDDDPGARALLLAWHQYQHAYHAAPRTRPGGYIIGVIPGQLRPVLDAMADILAQAYVCPATTWPWAYIRLDRTCCDT